MTAQQPHRSCHSARLQRPGQQSCLCSVYTGRLHRNASQLWRLRHSLAVQRRRAQGTVSMAVMRWFQLPRGCLDSAWHTLQGLEIAALALNVNLLIQKSYGLLRLLKWILAAQGHWQQPGNQGNKGQMKFRSRRLRLAMLKLSLLLNAGFMPGQSNTYTD